jgi:hypothetical protein
MRHKQKTLELEKEMEENRTEYEDNLKEVSNKSEEQLNQLKNFYKTEKEKLEKRV